MKHFIKRFRERLIPYLSGVAGSFAMTRSVLELFYDGKMINFWAFLLCAEVWAFVWSGVEVLPYLVCLLVFMAGPLVQITYGRLSVCLIFFSFVWLCGQKKHHRYLIGGVLLALSLAAAGAASYAGGDVLTENAFRVDRYLYRLYVALFGEEQELTFENGNVGRGNNYRSGGVKLNLLVNRVPEENLYLRGYIGADYTGSRWTEADERFFYQSMEEQIGKWRRSGQLQTVHQNIYFMLRYGNMGSWANLMQGSLVSQVTSEPRFLAIHQENGAMRQYTPYFSFHAERSKYNQDVENYYYYESSQMDAHRAGERLVYMPSYIRLLLQEYEDYTLETYLEVPTRRVSRLAALCKENEFTDLEEVTAFIRETLQADTVYTRTPGTTPVNKDVIEYFLFENKRGYCMHYASAATLMYRMYGIPARYVTGYIVYPSDFVPQPDGSYAAAITDYRKHAWVEIYQRGVGWTPVEMTPLEYVPQGGPAPDWLLPEYKVAVAGEGEGTALGQTGESAGGQAEEEEEEDEEEEEEEDEDTKEDEDEEEASEEDDIEEDAEVQERSLFWATFGIALLILSAAAVWYRRRLHVKALERMDARRLFYRLLQQLHMAKKLKGYTGAEPDFVEELCRELPCFTQEETTEFMEIVSEAAYGAERQMREEKREKAYAFYRKASEELYRHMGQPQKLYCTWVLNVR